jgi:hypothetical protein
MIATTGRKSNWPCRAAGVVEGKPGTDRRQSGYYIPAAHHPTPGVLDFGCSVAAESPTTMNRTLRFSKTCRRRSSLSENGSGTATD